MPGVVNLRRNEVHVWRVSLAAGWTREVAARALLDVGECARADRFVFERDRAAFTITRGALRTLLGHYLQVRPEAVKFSFNMFGKPFIAADEHSRPVSFNVSHSGECALLAFSTCTSLGIDIEAVQAQCSVGELASIVFAPRERDQFESLRESERVDAFFRAWTRKEAVVKAVGRGLAIPLDSFEVTFQCDDPPGVVAGAPDGGDCSEWSLRDVNVGREYRGAVAVRAPAITVLIRDW